MIDWMAFLIVFIAALIAAAAVVGLYALGLRLLVTAGRAPLVAPAEFTDAITVMSEKKRLREEKRVEKAVRKNPLTPAQRMIARIGAYACFVVCGGAVVYGIYLIIPLFH
ncbi:peptidase [Microbacterium sp. MPKO10]|uniref:peptidase n=1 Tax=Microbacterium sp. MPKO10 TaxID=2989818 RepID=UPI002235C085|nr:peptidase [Microbacterium sp. MPKO10]MCW4458301.1 peptidase [Microbacterium sp. MPKO10]